MADGVRLTDVEFAPEEWPDIYVVPGDQVTMQVMEWEGRLVWHLVERSHTDPADAIREGGPLPEGATP